MHQKDITIIVDAMGGDNTPFKTLKGTEIFLERNKDVKIVFLGNEKLIT